MSIDIEKERAAFSEWAKSENFNTNWHSVAKFFTNTDTQVRWEVWQAARATPSPAPIQQAQQDSCISPLRAEPAWQQEITLPGIAEYVAGTWFDARTIEEMQAFYMSRLPAIRVAAKEHGYAIGLHGSTRRDFDLMAMQWRADAADKDTLAHAIAVAACGITRDGAYEWEAKPNGRFAVSLPICWTDHANPDFNKPSMGHIDLSIIERLAEVIAPAGAAKSGNTNPCKACNGEGVIHTGIDEAPTSDCRKCDGSGLAPTVKASQSDTHPSATARNEKD